MAAVLSKSIFFHVGRTGGYWVRDVLAALGLYSAEIGYLHSSPAGVQTENQLVTHPFHFCFVRHPLSWLRSAWMVDVRARYANGVFGDLVFAPSYSEFLEALVARYPQGPVSALLSHFYDHCTFVGRYESLREDLALALFRAGERFVSDVLVQSPSVNSESNRKLGQIATAPVRILKHVLEIDRDYCRRFAYEGVAENFVSESPTRLAVAYPPLVLDTPVQTPETALDPQRPGESSGDMKTCNGEELRVRFDQGRRAEVESELRRRFAVRHILRNILVTERMAIGGRAILANWSQFVENFGSETWTDRRVAVICDDSDMIPLYLATRGAKVTSSGPKNNKDLVDLLGGFCRVAPRIVSLPEIRQDSARDGKFDVVVFIDSLHSARQPFSLIDYCANILAPGGSLFLLAGALAVLTDIPLVYCPPAGQGPYGSGFARFFTPAGLIATLKDLGFENINIKKFEPHGLVRPIPKELAPFMEDQTNDGRRSPIGRLLLMATRTVRDANVVKADPP